MNEELLNSLSGSSVGVYGYGNTGRSLVSFLKDRVGDLIVYDDAPESEVEDLPNVRWVQSPVVLQETLDYLFVSPGVPGDHPILRQAREFGVSVWGELELSYRLMEIGTIWAITGTNGKSTCTELLGRMLEQQFGESAVAVCGNRGSPLIDELTADPTPEQFVVEVSSFQVEAMDQFKPAVSLLTNLGDDHMNYHRTVREYHGLKLDLLKRTKTDGVVVVPEGYVNRISLEGRNVKAVDLTTMTAAGIEWDPEEGLLFDTERIPPGEVPAPLREFPENMLTVLAPLEDRLSASQVRRGLRAFDPLPYRAQPLETRNGRVVINDSKGTNPSAVVEQLVRRSDPVHLVLGGEAKEADYGPLIRRIKETNVLSVTLAGDGSTATVLSKQFEGESLDHEWFEDWETAVKEAYRRTGDGETLLLSPGGTSFDAFENYKKRGEMFDRWVREVDAQ